MISTTSASQARSHDQRVKDYLQAVESAKSKVKEFNEAIKSGNTARIKRVTLDILKMKIHWMEMRYLVRI